MWTIIEPKTKTSMTKYVLAHFCLHDKISLPWIDLLLALTALLLALTASLSDFRSGFSWERLLHKLHSVSSIPHVDADHTDVRQTAKHSARINIVPIAKRTNCNYRIIKKKHKKTFYMKHYSANMVSSF